MINKKNLITAFLDPEDKTDSKYGPITNEEWLKRELIRLEQTKPISGRVITYSIVSHPKYPTKAIYKEIKDIA